MASSGVRKRRFDYIRIESNDAVAKQRGIVGYRTLKVNDSLYLRIAITRTPGPRGGRSIVIGRLEKLKK